MITDDTLLLPPTDFAPSFFSERCLINILWISAEDKEALFQGLFSQDLQMSNYLFTAVLFMGSHAREELSPLPLTRR